MKPKAGKKNFCSVGEKKVIGNTCSVAIDEIEEQGHEGCEEGLSELSKLFVNERLQRRSLQIIAVESIAIDGSLTVSF